MAKSSSSSSNSENSGGELLCVGTLEIATPKPVGFLCGSIPVPTDNSFHSALLPTPQTVNAPRYRYRMLPTQTDLNTPPFLPVGSAVHSNTSAGGGGGGGNSSSSILSLSFSFLYFGRNELLGICNPMSWITSSFWC